MMTNRMWQALWFLVTDCPPDDGIPAIVANPDDVCEVVLIWPSGDRACVYWSADDRDWRFSDGGVRAPYGDERC